MSKLKMFFGAVAAVAVALPMAASAATIDNIQFDNNQVTTSCTAGSSVNVTFRVTIPANQVIELAQVDVLGDNLAAALPKEVGGELGLQEGENDIQMTVICPQNTANYTVQLKTAGVYGGQRAVTITDGVTTNQSFNNALRVTASGSGNTGSSSSSVDALTALVAKLTAQFGCMQTGGTWDGNACTPKPTTPVATGACASLQAKQVGTSYGVYNDANVAMQGFLLSANPNSIPALKAGSTVPMGYFGPQTAAAVSAYKTANGCI